MLDIKKRHLDIKSRYNCCGCAACYSICPTGAISMNMDEEGFSYPTVDLKKCIECSQCIKVCPIIATPKKLPVQSIFGCYARSSELQKSGSSGAFFSLLAERFLEDGGMVCGAVFGPDMSVHHMLTDRKADLLKIRGTKYVQSRTGDVFLQIRENLYAGKKILFCGTPCQVAGLKKFLGSVNGNLLCVDMICHGVPSPLVLDRYLKEKFGARIIKDINFREKSRGISNQQTVFYLDEDEILTEASGANLYMRGFINNYYLRPSCFACRFKGFERCADFTIGDFWSTDEFYPGFSNGFGVSAVMVRSSMGKKWFDAVSDQLCVVPTEKKQIVTWNKCLTESVKEPTQRKLFYERWHINGIENTINDLLQEQRTEKRHKSTVFGTLKSFIKKI